MQNRIITTHLVAIFLSSLVLFSCDSNIGTKSDLVSEKSASSVSNLAISSISGAFEFSDGSLASNCFEYIDSSAYDNQGDGFYRISSSDHGELIVYCNMSIDGGGWTRVFNHDTTHGVFAVKTDALSSDPLTPSSTKYSILNQVDSLRSQVDFEFYMNWPSNGACELTPHHWKQSTDPTVTTELVGDYLQISGGTTNSNGQKGLCLSSTGSALIDGNCGHSYWWYAVGQTVTYGGGVPACNSGETATALYIR